jgi:HK97 family phage portal protein
LEQVVWRLGRLRQLWNGKGIDAPFHDPSSWVTISGAHPGTGRKPENKADYIEQFTSWTYICGKLNAMSCASVPLELYAASPEKGRKWRTITTKRASHKRLREIRRSHNLRRFVRKAEDVDEVTEHAFLDLMRQVNPFFNSSDLMELTVLDMDLTGEAYWYVVRGKAGQPVELWPVPSVYMKVVPGKTLSRYIDHYVYQKGRTEIELSTDEVVQFTYPNPRNYIQGMSCVRGVIDAVYTNTKMNEYEEALFSNKARTGGVFESESDVSPTEVERMRTEIDARYVGNAAAGRPMMTPPGVKWVKDSMTNEEMSFIEGRKMTREEICAGFDIPVALLDPEAIRANVDGAQYHHAKFGIAPRLRKIEEKLNEKLLPMFDDSGVLFCAFENPVPDDVELELKTMTGYVAGSIMAINEARTELGLEPIEVEDANVPLVPFSLRPLGEKPPMPAVRPGAGGGGRGGEDTEDDLTEEADKLADLTLAKLKERLGVK